MLISKGRTKNETNSEDAEIGVMQLKEKFIVEAYHLLFQLREEINIEIINNDELLLIIKSIKNPAWFGVKKYLKRFVVK